jgi:ketosteroid isomerase-like protein
VPLDPLNVVQEVYAAFGRGDVTGLLRKLTPDVAWEVSGRRGDYPTFGAWPGREGVLAFFQTMAEVEDIHEFAPVSLHPAGETVLAQGRVALTLKTNGRALAYDWLHVFEVREGKVAAFREFYDTAQVVEAYRA